jgi:3-dehydroquinate dehydratase-2
VKGEAGANVGRPSSNEAPRPLLVVLHGVNLNMLGQRPAQHYGSVTLSDLESVAAEEAKRHGWDCVCRQTNHEGVFVEYLHQYRHADALLVNPGAWTHYSYAIRDALEIVSAPVAEVHLSDIHAREEWRRHSVISEVARLTIVGKGADGYREAIVALAALVDSEGRRGS